jgi:hypothetical protein
MTFQSKRIQALTLLILLTLVAAILHAPTLKRKLGVAIPRNSDASYYLVGAESIAEFEIDKKFNKDHYPIMNQLRKVEAGDMPWYAKYFLAPYPNPSFKFGYSLTIAAFSAPFTDSFLKEVFNPVIITNLILLLLTLYLVAAILFAFTGSYGSAFLGGLFFLVDTFFVHNNYFYASHTLSGLFFMYLALAIYLYAPDLKPGRLALIAFLLVFSVLSSSHHVVMAILLGGFIFVAEAYRHGLKQSWKYILASVVGAGLPIFYIVAVEKIFDFPKVGIPGYFQQFANYKTTVKSLIDTYPITMRFIWDWRLENIYFLYIVAISAVVILLAWPAWSHILRLGARELIRQYYKLLLTLLSVGLAFLMTVFYTQPITRAVTPFSLAFWITLGGILYWSCKNSKVRLLSFALVAVIAGLQVHNFSELMQPVLKDVKNPSTEIYALDEWPVVNQNRNYFFKHLTLGPVPYENISLSIAEFVKKHDQEFAVRPDLYLRFEGSAISMYYADIRRFIPKFMPKPEQALKQEDILKDFRLIGEILELQKRGELPQGAVIRERRLLWPIEFWDQEYNYIYAYGGKIKSYLNDTIFEDLDTRSIYFFRYADLRKAAGLP